MDVGSAPCSCAVDDDAGARWDLARPWLALYLGGMGAKDKNFYVEAADRFGHGDSAHEVQRLFAAGDRMGAAKALTPELIGVGHLLVLRGAGRAPRRVRASGREHAARRAIRGPARGS